MARRKRTLEIISALAIVVLCLLVVTHHLWPRLAAIGGLVCAFIVPGFFLVLAIHAALTDREP